MNVNSARETTPKRDQQKAGSPSSPPREPVWQLHSSVTSSPRTVGHYGHRVRITAKSPFIPLLKRGSFLHAVLDCSQSRSIPLFEKEGLGEILVRRATSTLRHSLQRGRVRVGVSRDTCVSRLVTPILTSPVKGEGTLVGAEFLFHHTTTCLLLNIINHPSVFHRHAVLDHPAKLRWGAIKAMAYSSFIFENDEGYKAFVEKRPPQFNRG